MPQSTALPADVQLTLAKLKELFGIDPDRQPEPVAEFIRFELQRRQAAFADDDVLMAAKLNDRDDRLAALEQWMTKFTPLLERLARTNRPTTKNIPINQSEDDE